MAQATSLRPTPPFPQRCPLRTWPQKGYTRWYTRGRPWPRQAGGTWCVWTHPPGQPAPRAPPPLLRAPCPRHQGTGCGRETETACRSGGPATTMRWTRALPIPLLAPVLSAHPLPWTVAALPMSPLFTALQLALGLGPLHAPSARVWPWKQHLAPLLPGLQTIRPRGLLAGSQATKAQGLLAGAPRALVDWASNPQGKLAGVRRAEAWGRGRIPQGVREWLRLLGARGPSQQWPHWLPAGPGKPASLLPQKSSLFRGVARKSAGAKGETVAGQRRRKAGAEGKTAGARMKTVSLCLCVNLVPGGPVDPRWH